MPNTKVEWSRLVDVGELESGDVLIKHVWGIKDGGGGRNVTELLIRTSNATHIFDKKGSQSAEHAAMVGSVNGVVRIFEAEGEGILVKNTVETERLREENAYTVYRIDPVTLHKVGMALLCDGMATRLAQIQNEQVHPIDMARYETIPDETKIRQAASKAHLPAFLLLKPRQSTRYGFGNMLTMVLPNLIPDLVYSKHDKRVLKFIAGDLQKIAYICSGLVAALLQAWSVVYFKKRVFNDPAQVHPTGLEHHFFSESFPGIKCVGRWGKGNGEAKVHAPGAVTDQIRRLG